MTDSCAERIAAVMGVGNLRPLREHFIGVMFGPEGQNIRVGVLKVAVKAVEIVARDRRSEVRNFFLSVNFDSRPNPNMALRLTYDQDSDQDRYGKIGRCISWEERMRSRRSGFKVKGILVLPT